MGKRKKDEEERVTLSKKMRRILKLYNKQSGGLESVDLTEAQIDEINRRSLPKNRISRILYKKPARGITTATFIIPVEEGVVTGYLYRSEDPKKQLSNLSPLIVFYHGGGWIWGNMEVYDLVCRRLCALTGAPILSIDYRLAPQHKFPIPVEDCYNALEWAVHGARYWKVDQESIYVMGDSAGGNLAAAVCRMARDRKGPAIAGQILIYPSTDGRLRTPSVNKFKESPTLTSREMQFFIQSYQREPKDILNPNFSPLLAKDFSRLPPALIITADNDPLLDDGKLYAEALISGDTPARYLECKNTVHGFFGFPDADGREESDVAIMQFLSGRALESIELMKLKDYRRLLRQENKVAAKANKGLISVEVE
ncbi:MAG: alpha/beta hydrolase [Spirochaetales bacterium]|nr:alpha/beta hydrolase [Spirochaetales bacterium]